MEVLRDFHTLQERRFCVPIDLLSGFSVLVSKIGQRKNSAAILQERVSSASVLGRTGRTRLLLLGAFSTALIKGAVALSFSSLLAVMTFSEFFSLLNFCSFAVHSRSRRALLLVPRLSISEEIGFVISTCTVRGTLEEDSGHSKPIGGAKTLYNRRAVFWMIALTQSRSLAASIA